MKSFIGKYYLLSMLLYFVIGINYVYSPDNNFTIYERNRIIDNVIRINEWNKLYEVVVESIKRQEGFRAYKYYCPAGVLTIGYGHAIRPNDTFCEPMSKETAEQLLRYNLDNAIQFVRRTTGLEHHQLLAMAHFVYNVGVGAFHSSTLRQLIINGQPIDTEITRWIHFTTPSGIRVQSAWLLNSRMFELNLYNNNLNYV